MPRLLPRRTAFDEYALRRLILRDYLAIERTRLANERTILSYLRTSLALVAGSVTLLHFFDTDAARITGWLLLPIALAILAFGLVRYISVRRRVHGYAHIHQQHQKSAGKNPRAEGPGPDGELAE